MGGLSSVFQANGWLRLFFVLKMVLSRILIWSFHFTTDFPVGSYSQIIPRVSGFEILNMNKEILLPHKVRTFRQGSVNERRLRQKTIQGRSSSTNLSIALATLEVSPWPTRLWIWCLQTLFALPCSCFCCSSSLAVLSDAGRTLLLRNPGCWYPAADLLASLLKLQ